MCLGTRGSKKQGRRFDFETLPSQVLHRNLVLDDTECSFHGLGQAGLVIVRPAREGEKSLFGLLDYDGFRKMVDQVGRCTSPTGCSRLSHSRPRNGEP